MKRAAAFFFLAMSVGASAQETGEVRYQRCLSLTGSNAQNAFDEALRWKDAGGGAPADHCSALALISLRHYRDGASILDALSQNSSLDAGLRADTASQAGSAWLQAGNMANADKSLSRALAINPSDNEARLDRAVVRARLKNWQGADEDLSVLLDRNPNRVDLLLLRASARHARASMAGAWADIEKVLSLKPNDPAALLERGAMRFETGDAAGARADWQKIIDVAPSSAEAILARQQLRGGAAVQPKSKTAPQKPAKSKSVPQKVAPQKPKPSASRPAPTKPVAKPKPKVHKPVPADDAPIKLKPPPVKNQPTPARAPILHEPQRPAPQMYGSGQSE